MVATGSTNTTCHHILYNVRVNISLVAASDQVEFTSMSGAAEDGDLTLQLYSGLFGGLSEWRLRGPQQVRLSPRLQEEERTLQHLRTSLSTRLHPRRLHSTERLQLSYGSVTRLLSYCSINVCLSTVLLQGELLMDDRTIVFQK
jgi:hypothetical protein